MLPGSLLPAPVITRRGWRHVVAAFGLAVTLTLAACSGSPEPVASVTPSARAGTLAAPSSATTRYSPLTGLPVSTLGPVLIVKIGNGSWERPPIGLADADVVYVEMVEGGLTRLAAVFSSRMPPQVGPVRSARETDVELLTQYGSAAFAYSGADWHVTPLLTNSPLQLVSFDSSPLGYTRDPSRRGASNVVGDPAVLLARAQAPLARAHDIGFRFGPPTAPGTPAATLTARWPSARIDATWDVTARRWALAMDGMSAVDAQGRPLGAATLLVQYVPTTLVGRHDSAGAPVSYSRTVGSGSGLLARDGTVVEVTWERPDAGSGTVWQVGSRRARFAPGPLWVLLMPEGRTVTVR